MPHLPSRHPQRETGYILIFVAIVLLALSIVSIKYFSGSISSKKVAAYSRDAEESFMLAESAMNTLYGGFIYEGDFNQDDVFDKQVPINIEAPAPFGNKYMYFVSAENRIDQTIPSILQRIADGEARAIAGEVNGAIVSATATSLRINDLFSGDSRPLVFTHSANGLQPTNNSWGASETPKAAVWIEVIRDTFQANQLYLFAQAAAQVGDSKSYVQRYIGEYSDTIGHQVSALTEANPNPGTIKTESDYERHTD